MPPKSKTSRRGRKPKSPAKGKSPSRKAVAKPIAKPAKKSTKSRSTRRKEGSSKQTPDRASSSSSPEKHDTSHSVRSLSPPLPDVIKNATNNLEEVYGRRGPKYLHKALTTCQDPQEMLQLFRDEEGVLVPTLKPAVQLLDLLEVTRQDFHMRCAEQLRQELMDKIAAVAKEGKGEAGRKRLEELLDRCFIALKLPLIRPIVLHIIRNLDTVDEKYKKEIMGNKELYDVCEIPLRRHIWIDRRDLFDSETLPLMEEYVANRERSMFDVNTNNSLYTIAGNIRRQDQFLVRLVENVGDRTALYEFANAIIKKRYNETGSPHYGTLRLDFLILLHERHPQMISSSSSDSLAYKFAFCMDSCVRARHVDSKRSKDILSVVDSLKRKDMALFCDVAMMLSDPQIAYFNATSAFRMVQAVVNQEGLPRDNNMLLFYLRLLSISTVAKDFVADKITKEPKVPVDVICDFLPKLCSVMVSIATKKINLEKVKLAKVGVDILVPFLSKEAISVWVVLQWVAYLLRQSDWDIVISLIRLFPKFCEQMPLKEQHLIHNMVIQFAHTPQEQRWPVDFANCIFHEYLNVKEGNPEQLKHALRLMYNIYPKLEVRYREEILACIETHVDTPDLKTLFSTVRARIATSVPVSPFRTDHPHTPNTPTEFLYAPYTPRR